MEEKMGAMVVVAEVVDKEAFGRDMEVWHGEREGTTVEKEAQEHDPHMGHRCRRHVSVPHKRHHCRAARARICIAGEHRVKLLSTTTMAAMVGVLVGAVVPQVPQMVAEHLDKVILAVLVVLILLLGQLEAVGVLAQQVQVAVAATVTVGRG